MVAAPKSLAIIVSAVARATAVMAPIARYAAEIIMQEVKEYMKNLVLTPPSPPALVSDSSSDVAQKSCKDRRFKKNAGPRKLSVFLSSRSMWSLKRSMKETTKSSKSSMMSSNSKGRAAKLKVLHAVDSRFRNVVNFGAYGLLDKS